MDSKVKMSRFEKRETEAGTKSFIWHGFSIHEVNTSEWKRFMGKKWWITQFRPLYLPVHST
jgi:predicted carbohydrate-binding protein with CBM5 and CBM33 domain